LREPRLKIRSEITTKFNTLVCAGDWVHGKPIRSRS
jgi:hypothetical protein